MEEDNSNQILRYLFRPRLPIATLKVSAEAENQLQVRSDGAYVPPLSWQTVEGA